VNFAHESKHVLFTGMTGKGKSTLVRSLVQKDRARWKFAFETYKREFPRFSGWPLCIDEPGLKKAVHAGKPSAFYSAPLFPGDRIEGFNFWIRWVYEVGKVLPGRKLVIIEEIEKTTAHRNSTLAPAFSEMTDEGRAMEFDIYMIAQRLSTVNELVRAQLTEICTFQHVDTNQLDWLRNEGFDTDAVQKLQRGEWIWRDREANTTRTNAKNRQKTVTPGKASPPQAPKGSETIVNRARSQNQPTEC
jgi:hypothetical protein